MNASKFRPVFFHSSSPSSSAMETRKRRLGSSSSSSSGFDTRRNVSGPERRFPSGTKRSAIVSQSADMPSTSRTRGANGKREYKLTIPSTLPEHAPSVPTTHLKAPRGSGFTYTDEDCVYFVNLVLWYAMKRPDASRTMILDVLGDQVRAFGPWIRTCSDEFSTFTGQPSYQGVVGVVLGPCQRLVYTV